MNAADVIAALAVDGIELTVRDGRLCLRPPGRAGSVLVASVAEHAAELRGFLAAGNEYPAPESSDNREAACEAAEERAAILEYDGGYSREYAERIVGLFALRKERQGAGGIADDERIRRRRAPAPDWDDLRPCSMCHNLARNGRCLAAWRSEIRAAADYRPVFPLQPRRCIGYAPGADDPDQTPGRERWPSLIESQTGGSAIYCAP